MKFQTLASMTAALFLSGCVAPVTPTRTPTAAALSEDWSTSADAMRVITYEPRQRNSTMSNSDLALLAVVGVVIGLGVAAMREPDRKKLGQVVWDDGRPCANCLVVAVITDGDDSERLPPAYCNSNGFFTIVIEDKSEKWWINEYQIYEQVGEQQYARAILDYQGGEDVVIVIAQ